MSQLPTQAADPVSTKGLSRDTAFLLAARLASAITTIVVLSIVGHARGSAELGAVGLGFASGAIVAAIAAAGSSSMLTREAVLRPEMEPVLLGAFTLFRAASLPISILVLVAIARGAFPGEAGVVFWTGASLVMQQMTDLPRAVFFARGRFLLPSIEAILEQAVWLGVILGGFVAGATTSETFALGTWVLAISVVACYGLVRFVLGVGMALPDRRTATKLARTAIPFAAFAVVGNLYQRIDTLLVGGLAGADALVAAGAYFSAGRLMQALSYLPQNLSSAVYPRLSRADADLSALLAPSVRILLIISVPIPFATALASTWVMTVLFGPGVAAYGWLLVALAALSPIRFVGVLLGTALTGIGEQGRRVVAVSVALVITLVINTALLPVLGLVAALIALALNAVVVNGIYLLEIQGRSGSLGIVRSSALTVGASLVAFIVGLLASMLVGPPWNVGAFVVVYALVIAGLVWPDRLTRWRGSRAVPPEGTD